ncbi:MULTISPECIES: EamA family transporter [unclassified Bacillus (in: firmicutes)]|uniref:EamA family transporter n=1 Tax=unclassified Bacillus (in: firmicutes) TaxID=185979 RepID=UPI003D1E210F
MYYLILLLNVCLLVSGQILWKLSLQGVTEWNLNTVFKVVFSPYFIGGGILYVLATAVWIFILSKIPFSIAYPLQSMSYIVGMLAAYFVFKEQIEFNQWFGVGLIILGAYFIAK